MPGRIACILIFNVCDAVLAGVYDVVLVWNRAPAGGKVGGASESCSRSGRKRALCFGFLRGEEETLFISQFPHFIM